MCVDDDDALLYELASRRRGLLFADDDDDDEDIWGTLSQYGQGLVAVWASRTSVA